MQLNISITGEDELAKAFDKFQRNLSNFDAPLLEIAELLEKSNEAGWGSRWPELADATIADKEHRGFSDEPLVRTGALKESLTQADSEFGIRRIFGDTLQFGTKLYYARFHQWGDAHEPKRQVLRTSGVKVRRGILAILREHLLGEE